MRITGKICLDMTQDAAKKLEKNLTCDGQAEWHIDEENMGVEVNEEDSIISATSLYFYNMKLVLPNFKYEDPKDGSFEGDVILFVDGTYGEDMGWGDATAVGVNLAEESCFFGPPEFNEENNFEFKVKRVDEIKNVKNNQLKGMVPENLTYNHELILEALQEGRYEVPEEEISLQELTLPFELEKYELEQHQAE